MRDFKCMRELGKVNIRCVNEHIIRVTGKLGISSETIQGGWRLFLRSVHLNTEPEEIFIYWLLFPLSDD